MARLNEPSAPPNETLDSLKRKFLRQNRDIAKQNASQSIRIRALENELSKALSENLQLREALNNAERIAESSNLIKMQLEGKMQELSALIGGIGKATPRRKDTQRSPAASPDQKKWKNRCTMSDAVNGQDGRLPAILENKYYPRKTLEREEILAIADTEIDNSPDIGPPPVSQFVNEDPVKIDLPRRPRKEEPEEPAALDPALSVNLEQRRKRKDSVIPSEFIQSDQPEERRIQESNGSLKIGAKRKLSVREDEETVTSGTSSPDDFKYTRVINEERPRKGQPPMHGHIRKTSKDLENPKTNPKDKLPPASIPTTRKILAPKSVNDSPKKPIRLNSDDSKSGKTASIKLAADKERPKEKRQEVAKILPPVDSPLDIIEVQTEPETPATTDLFSPLSSQPSTVPAQSRDTPPPTDIGVEIEGQRPSRRARGAVSYAEPNLRDKMRRPTKDLVDAVGKGDRPQRDSAVKTEDGLSGDPQEIRELIIKPEPLADVSWKEMPVATSTTIENSPLGNKTTVPELLPSSITTHRRRRESLLNQVDLESARPGSATAIANLLAETRKAKAAAREKASESDPATTKTTGALDIYEFKGSSPASDEVSEKPPVRIERQPASRFIRRQSTLPRGGGSTPEDGEESDMERSKRAEPIISSRRQSTLGLRSSSTSSLRQGDQDAGKSLKRSTSTTAMSEGPGASNGAGPRNDRMSARRRSMML